MGDSLRPRKIRPRRSTRPAGMVNKEVGPGPTSLAADGLFRSTPSSSIFDAVSGGVRLEAFVVEPRLDVPDTAGGVGDLAGVRLAGFGVSGLDNSSFGITGLSVTGLGISDFGFGFSCGVESPDGISAGDADLRTSAAGDEILEGAEGGKSNC